MTDLEKVQDSLEHWRDNLKAVEEANEVVERDDSIYLAVLDTGNTIRWDGEYCAVCTLEGCPDCLFVKLLMNQCYGLGWDDFSYAIEANDLFIARVAASKLIKSLEKMEKIIKTKEKINTP